MRMRRLLPHDKRPFAWVENVDAGKALSTDDREAKCVRALKRHRAGFFSFTTSCRVEDFETATTSIMM